MISTLQAIAFDDEQHSLDLLTSTFPGVVNSILTDLSVSVDSSEVICEALHHLRAQAPKIIILDLKWNHGAQYFDGIRFLRNASQENLLNGVVLIIWTQFLHEANLQLTALMNLLTKAGVQRVIYTPKSEMPPLGDLWR